jgi:predicted transcriptional regulator
MASVATLNGWAEWYKARAYPRKEGRSYQLWYGSMVGMARMVKVTFTLDVDTIERLRRMASRMAKPQSHVVREAVKDYDARAAKLSEAERARMLAIVDRMIEAPPTRPAAEVDAEIGAIRSSRRRWGRHRSSPRRP